MERAFKIYCHPKEGAAFEGGLLECSDISIQGTPSAMRAIGEFLISCAERFETSGQSELAHFHLRDEWRSWGEGLADIVGVSLPVTNDN